MKSSFQNIIILCLAFVFALSAVQDPFDKEEFREKVRTDRLLYLIWDPGDLDQISSYEALATTITENGGLVEYGNNIMNYLQVLDEFAAIFILFGIYPDNYVLPNSHPAVAYLVDYLEEGGNIYMEGGDTWAFDTQTALHEKFHIEGVSDGGSDTAHLRGLNFLTGLEFDYVGQNDWMDRLMPVESAVPILENVLPMYFNGIAYMDSISNYRTVGTSFQIGGLGSQVQEFIFRMLDFFDSFETDNILPPENIYAESVENHVFLTWDDPEMSDDFEIEIFRDSVSHAFVAQGIQFFVDENVADGWHFYELRTVTVDGSVSEMSEPIEVLVGEEIQENTVLIFEPIEVTNQSADWWLNDIRSIGMDGIVLHYLHPFIDLSNYVAIFISLGVFPNNHVLNDAEMISRLVEYLQNGGSILMEGGDSWAYDFQTSLHNLFHINGLEDGVDDTDFVLGADFLKGVDFHYAGENNDMDHLAPIAGAEIIHSNQTPSYDNGIAFDSGIYRTIGTSFCYSGVADDSVRLDLLTKYLDFFLFDNPTFEVWMEMTDSAIPGNQIQVDVSFLCDDTIVGMDLILEDFPNWLIPVDVFSSTSDAIWEDELGQLEIFLHANAEGGNDPNLPICSIVYQIVEGATVGESVELWMMSAVGYGEDIEMTYETSDILMEIPIVANEIISGDINFDGIVNVLDVVFVVNFTLGVGNPTDAEFLAADVNNDETINVLDVIQIVNIALNAE